MKFASLLFRNLPVNHQSPVNKPLVTMVAAYTTLAAYSMWAIKNRTNAEEVKRHALHLNVKPLDDEDERILAMSGPRS